MTIIKTAALAALGLLGASGAGVAYTLDNSVKAYDIVLHPTKYPWSHLSPFETFDHGAIRRGYEVYKNVCAACHSLEFVPYRRLIGVSHTEKEMKAEAAEQMFIDGPNDEGEMFKRPGTTADYFPDPYPNEMAAKFANNGSLPPDLSLITLARHGGEDYIFALLTGYCDAPAGVEVGEDLHYNPYFKGGMIGMAKALYTNIIEYDDGTPATTSQLAKDVSIFLTWAGSPELDTRHKFLVKSLVVMGSLFVLVTYMTKSKFSVLKSRKFIFKPRN